MFESVVASVSKVFASIPFTGATWFIIAALVFLVMLFAKASKDPKNPIRWEHLIIDSNNDRASPYKVGYLIGVVVTTWVVLTFADKDKLTYDILGIYLTYLLGGAGWNSLMKVKEEAIKDDTPTPVIVNK
jgi:hypothetical protein